ncbi:MAG: helix-turn-helix transcriptional regulator [Patescibacteria group bacterium]|nr:helix-turn-helix transcriptional regulator [Patescibacteria group bacterium]
MTESHAMIDASCPKCKTRIGWYGRVVDRPACHRCGHQVPRAELERDQATMDEFRAMLAELHKANPGWETWGKARVAAGLTLRQAAKLLNVSPTDLSAIERGETRLDDVMAERMKRLYGG